MIPHHSDTSSLLYTAVFLCRVVPTLCYNFLQLVGVRVNDGVAFYKVMGPLRVDGLKGIFGKVGYLEILGGGFTNFFPVLMVAISILSLFKVFDRIYTKIVMKTESDSEEEQSQGKEVIFVFKYCLQWIILFILSNVIKLFINRLKLLYRK